MYEPILSKNNHHPRDEFITFQEEGHKYTISCDPDTKYTSVTTLIHSHFPKFDADAVIDKMMNGKNWKEGHKYWGMTKQQIKDQWSQNGKNVSQAGTDMHFNIECFMNNDVISYPYTHETLDNHFVSDASGKHDVVEWKYFMKFIKDHPDMKPYRTEWLVYDEDLKLSGAIDMVYENPDGTLEIYDWKRSKDISAVNQYNQFATTDCISHMPDSNFWHYSLQLNTYRQILHRKYGKKVTALRLVRLHPDAEEETYEIIDVPLLDGDLKNLITLREDQLNGIIKIKKIVTHT